jgi:hypothetical protein
VKLGHVALDGTKIKANASKHKAMSFKGREPAPDRSCPHLRQATWIVAWAV